MVFDIICGVAVKAYEELDCVNPMNGKVEIAVKYCCINAPKHYQHAFFK